MTWVWMSVAGECISRNNGGGDAQTKHGELKVCTCIEDYCRAELSLEIEQETRLLAAVHDNSIPIAQESVAQDARALVERWG